MSRSETELILDNQHIQSIQQLLVAPVHLASYKSLSRLSLNNTGLPSLEGFPSFQFLEKLDLMDNRISSLLPLAKVDLPSLTHLDLANNRIGSVDALATLKRLPSLQHLNLLQCPVAKNDAHRDAVFDMLPSLVSLDFKDRDGNEVEYSDNEDDEDEEGSYDESEFDPDEDLDPNAVQDDDENVGDEHDEDEGEEDQEFNEDEDEVEDFDEVEKAGGMVPSGGKHRVGGKQRPSFDQQPDDNEDELELADGEDDEEEFEDEFEQEDTGGAQIREDDDEEEEDIEQYEEQFDEDSNGQDGLGPSEYLKKRLRDDLTANDSFNEDEDESSVDEANSKRARV